MLTRMRQIKLSEKNQILQGVSEVLVQCQSLVQSLSKFQVIDDGFMFSSSPTTAMSSTMMSNPRAKEESEFYHSVKEESMSDRSDEEESMSNRSDEESRTNGDWWKSTQPFWSNAAKYREVPKKYDDI